jgi:hypothetical protein
MKKNIKSKKPYILIINKFKNNNKLVNVDNYKKSISPLSGSELDYDPNLWNNDYKIRDSHNCYSYAMGKIVKGLDSKAQPGYASGFNHINDNEYECKYFKNRIIKDSPGTYIENFDSACLPGFYKVFLALDPQVDYHWWRQDSNGLWSHKPGSTNVTNLDADDNIINNPILSNRNYGTVNYKKPCFFACVYSDLTRTLDQIYRNS